VTDPEINSCTFKHKLNYCTALPSMMVRTVKLQLKSYGLLHSTSSRSSLQSSINSFQQFAAKAPNATPFLTVNILSSGSVHKKKLWFSAFTR